MVHVVGMLPRPAVERWSISFMNQIAVLPLVLRQRISLLPSPLKSPVSATFHFVPTLPSPPARLIDNPLISQIATLPLLSRHRMSPFAVAVEVSSSGDRQGGGYIAKTSRLLNLKASS